MKMNKLAIVVTLLEELHFEDDLISKHLHYTVCYTMFRHIYLLVKNANIYYDML